MRKFLMVAAVLAVAACGEKTEGDEMGETEMAPATTEMAPAATEMAPATDTTTMPADTGAMAADTSHSM